MNSASKEQCGS